MAKDKLVTKSNALVEASYRLNVGEQRVLALLVSQVSPDDEDFKPYRFKVTDLARLLDGNNKRLHSQVRQLTRGLIEKALQIRQPHGGYLQVSWLSAAEYYSGEGTVELEFSPKLKPYLLQLKERFTSYRLNNIVKLRSCYSVRLYELLKQYESLGSRSFELSELRSMLGLGDEYKTWKDFKRNVLEPALRELPQKTDLGFSYTAKRVGRKVGVVEFRIHPSKQKAASKPTGKQVGRLKAEATGCWSRINGNCAAKWSDHLDPKDTCHWCQRFETRRAEFAGQIRLPITN